MRQKPIGGHPPSATTIRIAAPSFEADEKQAVLEVLDSGMLAQGARVAAFEQAFAASCGVRCGVATSSGTTALQIALQAVGAAPDTEVITSSLSFIATGNAIALAGAKPVFADVNPRTLNLDPESVEKCVTSSTRAIVPVHLFGNPCDMQAIMDIAERHSLRVVEDACQAHGANLNGRPIGGFDVAAFSFYGTKNLTTGEGGMVTTNDDTVAAKCRLLRNHGQMRRYVSEIVGFNARMTEIAGALGLCQLPKLTERNLRRRENAAFYDENLPDWLVPQSPTCHAYHVYHQYTVRVRGDRADLMAHMGSRQIQTEVYYPTPIHLQTPFRHLVQPVKLPQTETAAREVLSLPVHPALTRADLRRVVTAVKEFEPWD